MSEAPLYKEEEPSFHEDQGGLEGSCAKLCFARIPGPLKHDGHMSPHPESTDGEEMLPPVFWHKAASLLRCKFWGVRPPSPLATSLETGETFARRRSLNPEPLGTL